MSRDQQHLNCFRRVAQAVAGRMDLRTAALELGCSLTQARGCGGWRGSVSRSGNLEAVGFGGCLGVGAEEGGTRDDSSVPGLGRGCWSLR